MKKIIQQAVKFKITLVLSLLLLLAYTSCVDTKDKLQEKRMADSLAITEVVNSFYKWQYEQKNNLGGFDLLHRDSVYIGIDFDLVKKNIDILENSGFFDNEFLIGYKQLADKIDAAYKNESFRIDDGIPPYGPFDYDIFYNCQDFPGGPFLYDSLKIDNNKAQICWGWKDWPEEKARYSVKLRFDNNKWKITNLMGFDQELKTTY